MIRFLCFFALILPFLSIKAQSQNAQDEMQSCIQRVDSLEHELSYLRISYELSTLNSDILMFTNEVRINSIELKLEIYNKDFDSRIYDSYKRVYESYLDRKKSFGKLIDAKKPLVILKVKTHPYSESELKALRASYNVIDSAYDALESTMDLLKITIDAYKKLM